MLTRRSWLELSGSWATLALAGPSVTPPSGAPAGPPYSVRDFGAKGDGTTNDAAAIQAAIDAAVRGGTIVFPAGRYVITAPLKVAAGTGRLTLAGEGKGAAVILNRIVGSPADPALEISVQGSYILLDQLTFEGNGQKGAAGNGHAISLVNTHQGEPFYPSQVVLRDVLVLSHLGEGKDHTGAAIPAAGLYAWNGTVLEVISSAFISNAVGVRLDTWTKAYFSMLTVDKSDSNAVYLSQSEQVTFFGSVLNNSGSGKPDDGLLHARNSKQVAFFGCRFKNGTPALVNLAGANYANYAVSFYGCHFEQLDPAKGHTAMSIGSSSACGLVVDGSRFEFVNTIKDAVGIEIVQGASGRSALGVAIRSNTFRIGDGGTMAAAISLNVAANTARSVIIEGNVIGWPERSGVATTITTGILLSGYADSCVVRNNSFVAATNVTIAGAIRLGSAKVTNTMIENNSYDTGSGGAITQRIDNAAATPFSLREGGINRYAESAQSIAVARTTPIDASRGSRFDLSASDGAPFVVDAPTGGTPGQRITITVRNASQGPLNAADPFANAAYRHAPWAQPAPGHSRSIDFQFDGKSWTEVGRTGGDVPN